MKLKSSSTTCNTLHMFQQINALNQIHTNTRVISLCTGYILMKRTNWPATDQKPYLHSSVTVAQNTCAGGMHLS